MCCYSLRLCEGEATRLMCFSKYLFMFVFMYFIFKIYLCYDIDSGSVKFSATALAVIDTNQKDYYIIY